VRRLDEWNLGGRTRTGIKFLGRGSGRGRAEVLRGRPSAGQGDKPNAAEDHQGWRGNVSLTVIGCCVDRQPKSHGCFAGFICVAQALRVTCASGPGPQGLRWKASRLNKVRRKSVSLESREPATRVTKPAGSAGGSAWSTPPSPRDFERAAAALRNCLEVGATRLKDKTAPRRPRRSRFRGRYSRRLRRWT